MVLYRREQGLITYVAPSQCVEVDLPFIELDFRTDQAVRPTSADRECSAKQSHGSLVGGPAKKDDRACWILVIDLPILGDFPAGWRAFDSRRGSLTNCPNELVRLRLLVGSLI
jgi:hypothetical protein